MEFLFMLHHRLKLTVACLIVVAITFLRVGESHTQNNGPTNSAGKVLPTDAAPLSQQVVRFMSPEPRTLDSSINDYDTESTIIPFEPLLRRDENWMPVPGAADSY
ncbi:uncharacterized protein METZ01_LOCUS378485, partial [marine metagenome]